MLEQRIIKPSEVSPVLLKFSKKFSLPKRPIQSVPDIPTYMDDLGDEELMNLYAEFIAWVSFAKADMVQAEIEEEREANNSRMIESKVLIEQWGSEAKGDRITIAKARRDTDKRVIEQQNRYIQAKAYRKLVESVYDRCERGAQLLSRELSRRIAFATKTMKGDNYHP